MPLELKIPAVGESISEVQIARWLKQEGDAVAKDESVAVLESDKATVELPSPVAGALSQLLRKAGEIVKVGEVIALIEEGAAGRASAQPAAPAPATKTSPATMTAPAAATAQVMPAAARALAETGLSPGQVKPTGPGGRLLKEDVQRAAEAKAAPAPALQTPAAPSQAPSPSAPTTLGAGYREEEVVPMTMLRRTVAKRLVEAQQTMAILTTFNEVDLSEVMALRKQFQEAFQAKYGIKVGFMSFFVKAVVDALRLVPGLNAEVRGNDILYRNYCDIGVAIGGGKGLVVPVLRNAERMSFAEIELAIVEFAKRAADGKIRPDELQGGTFSISNGGVYGSMLSTPIINPPQSGILGMHAIQDRPVARDGQVVIRAMMYLALSYDHRIVDGREAVTFLKRVKDVLETPARMLMEV
jgi:2-oxoglutarate dehydrogenase E2 component (dihydrolipoamide succinyltransferase)